MEKNLLPAQDFFIFWIDNKMSGVHIVGHNDTPPNAVLIITTSSNITPNDHKCEDHVYKAMFWVFMCLCVLVCVLIIMLWVRNKWRKIKQQVLYLLISLNTEGSVPVWHAAVLSLPDSCNIKTLAAERKWKKRLFQLFS